MNKLLVKEGDKIKRSYLKSDSMTEIDHSEIVTVKTLKRDCNDMCYVTFFETQGEYGHLVKQLNAMKEDYLAEIINLTKKEKEALHKLLGVMTYWRTMDLLCTSYKNDEECEEAQKQIIKIFNKLDREINPQDWK